MNARNCTDPKTIPPRGMDSRTKVRLVELLSLAAFVLILLRPRATVPEMIVETFILVVITAGMAFSIRCRNCRWRVWIRKPNTEDWIYLPVRRPRRCCSNCNADLRVY
jgi:hypothetical protein